MVFGAARGRYKASFPTFCNSFFLGTHWCFENYEGNERSQIKPFKSRHVQYGSVFYCRRRNDAGDSAFVDVDDYRSFRYLGELQSPLDLARLCGFSSAKLKI
ncbi:MAG: hypothetical protein CL831_03220 [Crocinitomicaceae bacterium]|nr:hypothetical protein [Crocinitomicaceae bacterium]